MTGAVIALTVFCVVLCLIVFRLYQLREAELRCFDDPARLPYLLEAMTERVRLEGDWNRLEVMRDLVRRALADLDLLRHDTTQQSLRHSKANSSPR